MSVLGGIRATNRDWGYTGSARSLDGYPLNSESSLTTPIHREGDRSFGQCVGRFHMERTNTESRVGNGIDLFCLYHCLTND